MPARGGTYQGMNWIWGPTRYAIYYRDRDPNTGFLRCLWCNQRVWVYGEKGVRRACLDHLVPVHLGGKHRQENLVTACVRCNNKHGGTHWEKRIASADTFLRIRCAIGYSLTKDDRAEGKKRWLARPVSKKGVGARRPSWHVEQTDSPGESFGEDYPEYIPF